MIVVFLELLNLEFRKYINRFFFSLYYIEKLLATEKNMHVILLKLCGLIIPNHQTMANRAKRKRFICHRQEFLISKDKCFIKSQ